MTTADRHPTAASSLWLNIAMNIMSS